jgi:hypothetical protein
MQSGAQRILLAVSHLIMTCLKFCKQFAIPLNDDDDDDDDDDDGHSHV